jgi:hypothetical protein
VFGHDHGVRRHGNPGGVPGQALGLRTPGSFARAAGPGCARRTRFCLRATTPETRAAPTTGWLPGGEVEAPLARTISVRITRHLRFYGRRPAAPQQTGHVWAALQGCQVGHGAEEHFLRCCAGADPVTCPSLNCMSQNGKCLVNVSCDSWSMVFPGAVESADGS